MTVARISSSGFLAYATRDENPGNPQALEKARAQLEASGYHGNMSAKTKGKVKRYVSGWLTAKVTSSGNPWASHDTQARRITFATFTLPAAQTHTDNQLKRLALMPLVQELGRRYNCFNYIWKLEGQGTGNAHFHILLDKFVPQGPLRKLWNSIMQRLGYIDSYRHNQQTWHANGFRVRPELLEQWPAAQQREAYTKGQAELWTNPNTTDIHALSDVKNVVAYVVKYVSKDNEGRKLQGRVWGCSDSLRELEPCQVEMSAELDQVLRHEVEEGRAELLQGEGWSFYRCQAESLLKEHFPHLHKLFFQHWREQARKLPGIKDYQRRKVRPEPEAPPNRVQVSTNQRFNVLA